jgi:hypothetical protein
MQVIRARGRFLVETKRVMLLVDESGIDLAEKIENIDGKLVFTRWRETKPGA